MLRDDKRKKYWCPNDHSLLNERVIGVDVSKNLRAVYEEDREQTWKDFKDVEHYRHSKMKENWTNLIMVCPECSYAISSLQLKRPDEGR